MAARYTIIVLLSVIAVNVVLGDLQCTYDVPDVPTNWIVMAPECQDAMTALINTKLLNSAQYLALGAYFSRDSVNRIGFSDLFYINADANRDQAIELIDYIVLRGEYTSPDNILQLFYTPAVQEWDSAEDAVTSALNLEADLTNQFHNTIVTCESQGINDYNIANWLSRYFLGDQYSDQKFFADLISSLDKMKAQHQDLGEFFADLELLSL
ncbi:ferritin heavy chain-like [Atheta coriaria]|uniref:ferritin heavy chain-like n=1 Tax=Dalotia coriaria TaxID=877792 RepID=UPI0031F33BE1